MSYSFLRLNFNSNFFHGYSFYFRKNLSSKMMKATIFSASCQTTVLLSWHLHMNKMSVRTPNKFAFILMWLVISCYLKEHCRILQEVQLSRQWQCNFGPSSAAWESHHNLEMFINVCKVWEIKVCPNWTNVYLATMT